MAPSTPSACGNDEPHAAHPIPCRDEPWEYRPHYVMCPGAQPGNTALCEKRPGSDD